MRLYDDLGTFFRERGIPQRPDGSWAEDSYDYGVWWLDDDLRSYRLTWIGARGRTIDASGELYLVRLSGPVIASLRADVSLVSAGNESGTAEYLCRVPPTPCERCGDGTSDTCFHSNADAAVEALLDGWADVCGEVGSVRWVRDRAAEAEMLWGAV